MGIQDILASSPWVFESLRNLIDPLRAEHLKPYIDALPHASVLDLGCGIGNLAGMTDGAYTGLDIDPAYIKYAQKRASAPNRRFVTGNALALDPSLGTFELVAINSTIHHLSDDEVVQAIQQALKLKPRNILIMDTALEKTNLFFRWFFKPLDRGAHFRTLDAQKALMERAGLSVTRAETIPESGPLYPHSLLVGTPKGGS